MATMRTKPAAEEAPIITASSLVLEEELAAGPLGAGVGTAVGVKDTLGSALGAGVGSAVGVKDTLGAADEGAADGAAL
jgi:hypothetical protein